MTNIPNIPAGSRWGAPPTAEELAELAEIAFAAIPAPLREAVRGTLILVEELPDDETLESLGLEHPWELTGLDRGVPLTENSVLDAPAEPDTILLYREPILVEWVESGEDLFRLVRTVLIHEIAHHFGYSEEGIARLEGEG